MGNKLYVGNLSFNTTEIALQDAFAQFGTVSEVLLMQDKFTGRSRGFAFVTMASDAEAQTAIEGLHGKELDGRQITVNEARPREDRPPRRSGDRSRRDSGRDRHYDGGRRGRDSQH